MSCVRSDSSVLQKAVRPGLGAAAAPGAAAAGARFAMAAGTGTIACAISGETPTDPVFCSTGYVFERRLIEKHIEAQGKSPQGGGLSVGERLGAEVPALRGGHYEGRPAAHQDQQGRRPAAAERDVPPPPGTLRAQDAVPRNSSTALRAAVPLQEVVAGPSRGCCRSSRRSGTPS